MGFPVNFPLNQSIDGQEIEVACRNHAGVFTRRMLEDGRRVRGVEQEAPWRNSCSMEQHKAKYRFIGHTHREMCIYDMCAYNLSFYLSTYLSVYLPEST